MDVQSVSAMKVAELRHELVNRGLDSSGLKADLAQRLSDAIEDGVEVKTSEAAEPEEQETTGEKRAPPETADGDAESESAGKRGRTEEEEEATDAPASTPVDTTPAPTPVDTTPAPSVSSATASAVAAAMSAAMSMPAAAASPAAAADPAAAANEAAAAQAAADAEEAAAQQAASEASASLGELALNLFPQTPQGMGLGQTAVSTTLIVPAAAIHGAGPAALVAIRAKSPGCTLELAPPGTPAVHPLLVHETTVALSGPFPAVHAAYSLVVALCFPGAVQGIEETKVKLVVSNDNASVLIGKQGSVIRDVRLGLGGVPNCFTVASKDAMNPAARLVAFTGNLDLMQRAHELVQDRIANAALTASSLSATSPGGGKEGSAGGAGAPGPGETEVKVQVPNESLGAVIGKGGSRVQEVRDLSGARVSIETKDRNDPSPFRLVTIVGEPDACEWAKYLISVSMSGGEPSQALGDSVPPGLKKRQAGGGGGSGGGRGGGGGGGGDGGGGAPQYSVAELTAAGYTPQQIADYMTSQQNMGGGGGGGSVGQVIPLPSGGEGVKVGVAPDCIGAIMGKGGARITHMRELSGAKISLVKEEGKVSVRWVVVEGNAMAVAAGQVLLKAAISGTDVGAWQMFDLQKALQQQQSGGGCGGGMMGGGGGCGGGGGGGGAMMGGGAPYGGCGGGMGMGGGGGQYGGGGGCPYGGGGGGGGGGQYGGGGCGGGGGGGGGQYGGGGGHYGGGGGGY